MNTTPRARHTTPTKQQELAILDRAIDHLGPQSYLAPWLAQVKAEVEQQVRSDFFPQVTLAESRRQAEAIIAEAKAEAERIRERAAAERDRAERSVDELKAEGARAIAQASVALGTLATRLSSRQRLDAKDANACQPHAYAYSPSYRGYVCGKCGATHEGPRS